MTASPERTPALEVRGLHVAYGRVEALHGVDVVVPEGSIVSVIGPNGAGKTTMLNAIMGVLPCRGTVRLDGEDIGGLEIEQRVARRLCLVPERRELFGTMSVEDNLILGGFSRYRPRDRAVWDSLREVYGRFPRLAERRSQLAATLSGGERQMLAIGRALMARPRVLLLDEPSLGLAPRIVREVLGIVTALRDLGVSVLLVEQNARAALQVSDHGTVLEMGRVALQGPSRELAADRRVVESYLGLTHAPPDRAAATA